MNGSHWPSGSPTSACDHAAPITSMTMPAYAHSLSRAKPGAEALADQLAVIDELAQVGLEREPGDRPQALGRIGVGRGQDPQEGSVAALDHRASDLVLAREPVGDVVLEHGDRILEHWPVRGHEADRAARISPHARGHATQRVEVHGHVAAVAHVDEDRALTGHQIARVGDAGLAIPDQQVTGRVARRVHGFDRVAIAELDRPAVVDRVIDREVEAARSLGVGEDRDAVCVAERGGVADVIDVVMGDEHARERATLGSQRGQQRVELGLLARVRGRWLDDQQAVATEDDRVGGRRGRQRRGVERE